MCVSDSYVYAHLRYEKFHRNAESRHRKLTLDFIFIYNLFTIRVDLFRYVVTVAPCRFDEWRAYFKEGFTGDSKIYLQVGHPSTKLYIDIFFHRTNTKDSTKLDFYYPYGGFPAAKQPAYTMAKSAVYPLRTITLEGVTLARPKSVLAYV